MGSITATTDTTADLTVFTAAGTISAADIIAAINAAYASAPTRRAIWDFREADGSRITGDQLKGISHAIEAIVHDRKEHRTALVYGRAFGFGMGRMYETMIESERIPVTMRLFYDLEEARNWVLET